MAALLPEKDPVLDLACGTGDLTLLMQQRAVTTVGLDPSLEMLLLARKKGVTLTVCGQAEALPFRSGIFRTVTVAFGLRNFSDPVSHFRETSRITTDDASYGILEFSLPTNFLLRFAFSVYRLFIPWIGWVFSGSREAYAYLSQSIQSFSKVDRTELMRGSSWKTASRKPVLGAIVTIDILKKESSDDG